MRGSTLGCYKLSSVGVANVGMLATDATVTIYDGGAVPYSTEPAHDVPDIDQNTIITHPDPEWTATAGNPALVAYADNEEILPDGVRSTTRLWRMCVQPTMDFALTGVDVVTAEEVAGWMALMGAVLGDA